MEAKTMEIDLLVLNKFTVHLKRTREWQKLHHKELAGLKPLKIEPYETTSKSKSEIQRERKNDVVNCLRFGSLGARIPMAADFPIVQFDKKPPFSYRSWDGTINVRAVDMGIDYGVKFDARFDLALGLAQHNRSWWHRKLGSTRFPKLIVYIYFFQLNFAQQENAGIAHATQVYVGLTKDSFSKRLQSHCNVHASLCDVYLHMVHPGRTRMFVLDMAESYPALLALEARYIRMFNAFSEIGLNMINGSSKHA